MPGITMLFIHVYLYYVAFDDEVVFSDEEWNRFQKRIEEGYDVSPTGRYKLWLEMYHTESFQGINYLNVIRASYTPFLELFSPSIFIHNCTKAFSWAKFVYLHVYEL